MKSVVAQQLSDSDTPFSPHAPTAVFDRFRLGRSELFSAVIIALETPTCWCERYVRGSNVYMYCCKGMSIQCLHARNNKYAHSDLGLHGASRSGLAHVGCVRHGKAMNVGCGGRQLDRWNEPVGMPTVPPPFFLKMFAAVNKLCRDTAVKLRRRQHIHAHKSSPMRRKLLPIGLCRSDCPCAECIFYSLYLEKKIVAPPG